MRKDKKAPTPAKENTMKSNYLIRSLTLLAGLLFIGATAQAATTLTSVKTDKPVLLSGTADKV